MEEKLKQLDTAKALFIGLALGAAFYFLFYNDGSALKSAVEAAHAQIQQKTSEVESMKKTLVDAQKHKELSAKLGEELDQVIKAVPENFNSVELMKLVSTEAKSVGLNILSISGAEGKATDPGNNFVPVNVTVSFSGTFNQIMMFMSNLTKSGRIILTKNVSLTGGSAVSSTAPMLGFSATLEAFRYQDKPGVTK